MWDLPLVQTNIDKESFFETINSNSNSLNSIEMDLNGFIGYPFNFEKNIELEEIIPDISSITKKESTKEDLSQKKLFLTIIAQKRGRKIEKKNNGKEHGKYDEDNIVRKIQVSYINFIIDLINEVLKGIGRKDLSLIPLDYLFKRVVNKRQRDFLKSHTVEEVIQSKTSPKYKTKNENVNKEICEKIKKEKIYIMSIILKTNFFFFFDKIYYRKARRINLKDFGLVDLEINLDNLELYEDLLLKNKKDIHFEKYRKKIDFCAKKYFLPKNQKDIFKCNY
jgi:hypothetical protein